jgi:hypothetical protein
VGALTSAPHSPETRLCQALRVPRVFADRAFRRRSLNMGPDDSAALSRPTCSDSAPTDPYAKRAAFLGRALLRSLLPYLRSFKQLGDTSQDSPVSRIIWGLREVRPLDRFPK